MIRSVVWTSERIPSTEYAVLDEDLNGFTLRGVVICSPSDGPMRIDYHVLLNPMWETTSVSVTTTNSEGVRDFIIVPDASHNWHVNGQEIPAYRGCIDIDLGFSPVTNTLPIRRLGLKVGHSADVEAAWLQYPGFAFVRLPQRYTHLSEQTYIYESQNGGFRAQLDIDEHGLVETYEGIWRTAAIS